MEIKSALDRFDALVTLAASNFPRNTDIRVECVGTDNSGVVIVKIFELKEILRLARSASAGREEE